MKILTQPTLRLPNSLQSTAPMAQPAPVATMGISDRVQLEGAAQPALTRLDVPARFSMFRPLEDQLGTLQCQDSSALKARAKGLQARGISLIAVRHGESEANAAGGGALLSGRGDSPLTATGRQQARQAAESLFTQHGESWLAGERTPVLYASPLSRAYETATALQQLLDEKGISVPLQAVPDLQEIDFGNCEGRNAKEVAQQYPNFGRGTDFRHRFPEGESGLDVMARVDHFLDQVATHHGQDVLFFGHTMTVGIARMLLGEVEHNDRGELRIDRSKIPNAAPMTLVAPPSRPKTPEVDGYILR